MRCSVGPRLTAVPAPIAAPRPMTIRLAVCALALASTCAAPSAQSGVLAQLVGRGVDAAPGAVSVDVYPFILTAGGIGGTVGYEWGHWHVGAAAFTVEPPGFIEDTFFRDTDGLTLTRNAAVEGFVRYYLRADRRWLYAEVIGGPDWFELTDDDTGVSETIGESYVTPRLGVRVLPLGDLVSIDAAVAYAINVTGTEERTLGSTTYRAAAGGVLPFLQIGTRIPIRR